MKARKFKPGDWVTIKGELDSPLMQVINYPDPVHDDAPVASDAFVKCVFYRNGRRHEKIYHQGRLVKRRMARDMTFLRG